MPVILKGRSRSLNGPDDGIISRSGQPTRETYNTSTKKWSVTTSFPVVSAQANSFSTQFTESMSHERGRDGKYHSGGPFYTKISGRRHRIVTCGDTIEFTKTATGLPFCRNHQGGVPITMPSSIIKLFEEHNSIPDRSQDLSDLDAFGAEAISRCSPANPASEVGTGVSELYREGLPSLAGIPTWRHRTDVARGAGHEYLNYQFGWVPLASEVKNFASVVRRHRDILNQYHRDAGRTVRRRFDFPIDNSETVEVIGHGRPTGPLWTDGALTPKQSSEPPEITVTRGSSIKRWFSGSFTYDVPSQSDSWQRALGYGSDADILFGASLNPELLWNLTPWSWAVDWFSNTGDIINNISNYVRAGQVMRYGYVMEERTSFIRLSMSESGYPGIPAPAPIEYFCTTKVRQPANPYGFGLTEGDLSPTQLAIIAALGITLL